MNSRRGEVAPVRPRPRREAGESWPYVNVDGTVLFWKQKILLFDRETGESLGKKYEYRYQTAEQQRSGSRVWWTHAKPPGADSIPFALDELLPAVWEGQRILICEGEKDADAARVSWDVCASTTHLGAAASHGCGWTPGMLAWFARADRLRESGCARAEVVIVADRDPTGLRHAYRTRLGLIRHGHWPALGIQILLPAPEHRHADLSDHIAAGLDFDELEVARLSELRAATAELDRRAAVEGRNGRGAGGARPWDGSGPYASDWTLKRRTREEPAPFGCLYGAGPDPDSGSEL
jgi:hypothetical protein